MGAPGVQVPVTVHGDQLPDFIKNNMGDIKGYHTRGLCELY
jgi:hypothetical protein